MARTDAASGSRAAPQERVNVLGVGVAAVDLETAVRTIEAAVARGAGGYVCVTGVHGVMEAHRDAGLRQILNSSLISTPDGVPMVWLGRSSGFRAMRRVYGPDLMLALCRRSVDNGYSHFLYGGVEGVASQLAQRLGSRFPGLHIVGTHTPPFRPMTSDEENDMVGRLRQLRPSIVWVGLSTPKQERLMARLSARIAPSVMIGVGAAFDIHSGRVPQAPLWMQRSGLEWLFRMVREPRRLGPRYIRNNPLFVYEILRQQLGLRRYSLEP